MRQKAANIFQVHFSKHGLGLMKVDSFITKPFTEEVRNESRGPMGESLIGFISRRKLVADFVEFPDSSYARPTASSRASRAIWLPGSPGSSMAPPSSCRRRSFDCRKTPLVSCDFQGGKECGNAKDVVICNAGFLFQEVDRLLNALGGDVAGLHVDLGGQEGVDGLGSTLMGFNGQWRDSGGRIMQPHLLASR